MIETDTSLDLSLLVDIDNEVKCTEFEHGVPAQWLSTHSCCGTTEFLCNAHKVKHENFFKVAKEIRCKECRQMGHPIFRKI